MDVDSSKSPSKKRLSTSPAASSATKRARVALQEDQLTVLNGNMKTFSKRHAWQARIGMAVDDISLWQGLFSDALIRITQELAVTSLKGSVIACSDGQRADDIVKSFNEDELEEWKVAVRKGVEEDDWTDLIGHPKLKNTLQPSVSLGVPIEQQDAVIHAWNLEYRGDSYVALLAEVDHLHTQPSEKHHVKVIPVTQSSGTGKSKTVDKIAMERILIPLCLRESLGDNYFGAQYACYIFGQKSMTSNPAFPPADIVIRDHLIHAPGTGQEIECKEYLRSFLRSLFTSVHLLAERLLPEGGMVTYAHLAKTFYNFFKDGSQRNVFYKGVIEKAVAPNPSTDVWESFRELESGLKQRCSNWLMASSCPILMSIDEVHILHNIRVEDVGSHYTLYSRLKSVFSDGVREHLCVIVLSTATHMPALAPPKKVAPSIRERDDERLLPAPFTELPFDVYIIAEPLSPGGATLQTVGSLEFTAKFGRPWLYASYLSHKSNGTPQAKIIDTMMLNVREKLCGLRWPLRSPAVLDPSSIAILSSRLLLDLSPTASDTQHYEEQLPLLAEAAAQIMHSSIAINGIDKPYMDLWALLGEFVDRGLAAQGNIGKLIGRALSISAMDNAIHAMKRKCELVFQTPVTVSDYYKALLTDDAWTKLRRSMPANRARLSEDSATKAFEDAFANAFFHFSHYGKANDASPMRDKHAWAHWLRGTAIVCQPNQELSDRVTPIYFSSLGAVAPETMSANLDQDKTGQSINPNNVAVQLAETLEIFEGGKKIPYIAAVHCYALTTNEGITVTDPNPYDLRNTNDNDKEAPRYQIDFRGLASYRNIDDPIKIAIRRMINSSKNALFTQHPRQFAIPLLRRQQPVLAEDPDSMAWYSGVRVPVDMGRPKKKPKKKKGKG